MTTPPVSHWAIVPVLAAPDLTEATLADLLAQSVSLQILVINQGVDDAFRGRLERLAEEYPDRIFLWSHQPPLPSLSATWNRALWFVWEAGGSEALVVNNDVRLHPRTYECLDGMLAHTPALFVSAVGVTADQFDASAPMDGRWLTAPDSEGWGHPLHPGGPDFSCFLIAKAGHEQYPFDEAFIPAHCEDLDMHRRYLLGGDGDKIFSINLPFLHVGSGTLKHADSTTRQRIESQTAQIARAHYRLKWGGDVNEERFTIPFDHSSAQDGVTTPDLQRLVQGGGPVPMPRIIDGDAVYDGPEYQPGEMSD